MVNVRSSQEHGGTYLMLLLLIALLGAVTAATVTAGARLSRQQAEHALLDIGEEYAQALAHYRATGVAGQRGRGPRSLQDLLGGEAKNGRVLRYLRRIYEDPLTGRAEWGLLRATDGSVAAVYSLAPGTPIKRAGFGVRGEGWFADAPSYAAWCFGLATADPSDRGIWLQAQEIGCRRPRQGMG